MNLYRLKDFTAREILRGSFGIEWETLRVKKDGRLSLTPHPTVFGDKYTNPIVTTDFSESQIEIITPTFNTIDKAFDTFSILSDLVNSSLPDDEYLWFQSIPCILPYWNQIPIAKYPKEGKTSQKYRENLANKYGVKKQMISGVHFNFSFSDYLIDRLFENEVEDISYKEFKNNIYLKITRNYIRYCWLIIYLTGASIGSHKTFSPECIHLMDKKDEYGSYYSTRGPSFRNASCGYKNIKDLFPSYDSVREFVKDLQEFINNGDLSEAKELYSQIRLKTKNPSDLLNSLKQDGIEYLEIRTLDINPFYKCGLVKHDMKFLHLFLIYMLIKEESDYPNWQLESKLNEENAAERGYVDSMRLLKDGKEVKLKDWACEIIEEMYEMCEELNITKADLTLNLMYDRILKEDLTYGKRLLKLIRENGYINTHIQFSKNNKQSSIYNLEKIDFNKCEELKKYANIALSGNKVF
ncbi:glutamate--cysteine ligase [uncultured Methanobrevibacter sp.]|uniref:glutamate--cysteine ligase n=1 Tax=uncultured Methanobrevibacter sp. TaxID=253161 RepID=UPI0025E0AF68|nr:glutamate--cysteine ligase [uncultured Methanobrevibacter sp.]